MKAFKVLSGYEVYPTAFEPRNNICNKVFGIASRNCSRRLQGFSVKKRKAASNVAPPQTSIENRFGKASSITLAGFTMSRVRIRVAINDWCASRIVVSVNNKSFEFLIN